MYLIIYLYFVQFCMFFLKCVLIFKYVNIYIKYQKQIYIYFCYVCKIQIEILNNFFKKFYVSLIKLDLKFNNLNWLVVLYELYKF